MLDILHVFWLYFAASLDLILSLGASGHAVTTKRDPRAAISWLVVIWLAPFLGVLLYVWLGINRIQRRARSLRPDRRELRAALAPGSCDVEQLERTLTPQDVHLCALERLMRDVTHLPLVAGNQITPLINGDQAYPAMLQAIEEATRSVALSTYIFARDAAGERFVEALQRAVARGVEVRVLIDAVGARRFGWWPMLHVLRRAGVPCAPFLPTLIPWKFQYSNLRCHRKILVVDGRTGFTGGMNLHAGNCLLLQPRHPVQDLHFRLAGPVVRQLQQAFADDWHFSIGEVLCGEPWFTEIPPAGCVLARGVPDGPDEDFEALRFTLLGAIGCARHSIQVVTPYFLPDASLVAALNVAALRGVQVDIVLPAGNDLALVQWASTALLWQVLEHGCRVWLSPPPFDHTKLLLVDGAWTLLGSANWDPRSLRLNFEFNVECYDRDLATGLETLVRGKIANSRCLGLADVDGRSLPIRLRDGLARLFSPFL
jgi:cardiolipin synthase A/B